MTNNSVFVVVGEDSKKGSFDYKLLSAHMDKAQAESDAAFKKRYYDEQLKLVKSLHELYDPDNSSNKDVQDIIYNVLTTIVDKEVWDKTTVVEVPITAPKRPYRKLDFRFLDAANPNHLEYNENNINFSYRIVPKGVVFEAIYKGHVILHTGSLSDCIEVCTNHYNEI